ncbi:MAG: TolC family protein [Verrucomicrobiales bacterium]|nr:TolC family protein [Verrucomicrobiales bacterium]
MAFPEWRQTRILDDQAGLRPGAARPGWVECVGRGMIVGALVMLGLAAGCSPKRYEKAADREVYRTIADVEQRIFGRTNQFRIDTAYTGRDLDSITAEEILQGRQISGRRVLHLEEALSLAVANSREYQTQKEQLYLSALTLTGARYQFTPRFLAETAPGVAGSVGGSDQGTIRSQVGVSQLMRTGGRLSVSLANDLLHYFSGWRSGSGGGTRDTAISMLSVQLTQPLLRGFGRNDPTVESLTQAERNVVYAIRTYSQYQHQFAVNVVNDYFSLLGQKDVVRNNYTNYLRRVDTTKYLEARAVDRVRASDVDDARSAELSARISYIDSVANYMNEQASFKLSLGLPLSEEVYFDDRDLVELSSTGLVRADIDRNAAFKLAVTGHMDVLNAIDRFEDARRKVRIAADQLKPGIGLVSTASLESQAPDDYAKFNLDDLRYSAELNIDLPLDRLRERNTYRASQVSFEAQVRSLSLTLDSFKDRIERGLRTLEQRRLNYLNRQAALEVARRRVELNAMQLEAGRVQIRDLREAQDQLIGAQNQLTLTLVSYLQARLQVLLDIGVLRTETEKFWLRDPLEDRLEPGQRGASPLPTSDEDVIPPDRYLEPPVATP